MFASQFLNPGGGVIIYINNTASREFTRPQLEAEYWPQQD